MKVQVELQEGETQEEAEELLLKALNSQRDGKAHSGDQFPDKAMEHMAGKLKSQYGEVLGDMMAEIEEVIDS